MINNPHDIPVPYERGFDDLEDAVRWVADQVKEELAHVEWVKLFPAEDEADVRLRWSPDALFHDLSRTAQATLAELGQVAA